MALVEQFAASGIAPINTDDRNQIEYGFARTVGRNDLSIAATLHYQSTKIDDHRPAVKDGEIDTEMVNLERQWFALLRTGKMLVEGDPALNPKPYDQVLRRCQAADFPGMLTAWESLPHSTTCLTELTIIALAYSFAGNDKAEPLIEQIRPHQPTEAEALRGILLLKQKKLPEAGPQLAALPFQRLHDDPWPVQMRLLKKRWRPPSKWPTRITGKPPLCSKPLPNLSKFIAPKTIASAVPASLQREWMLTRLGCPLFGRRTNRISPGRRNS